MLELLGFKKGEIVIGLIKVLEGTFKTIEGRFVIVTTFCAIVITLLGHRCHT
jgi:hypothetical protein